VWRLNRRVAGRVYRTSGGTCCARRRPMSKKNAHPEPTAKAWELRYVPAGIVFRWQSMQHEIEAIRRYVETVSERSMGLMSMSVEPDTVAVWRRRDQGPASTPGETPWHVFDRRHRPGRVGGVASCPSRRGPGPRLPGAGPAAGPCWRRPFQASQTGQRTVSAAGGQGREAPTWPAV
jgi:hypothetical protein